jgi:hypothetical protein
MEIKAVDNKTKTHQPNPTFQINIRRSNSRKPPFLPSITTKIIPAVLALKAPSCENPDGIKPVLTSANGILPRIEERINKDSAGYFLTKFVISIS